MKRFKNILLVSDLKPKSKNALNRAVGLAEKNQAKLTVVDVMEESPGLIQKIFAQNRTDEIESDLFKEKSENLKKAIVPLAKKIPNISYDVLKGKGFVEIIRKVHQDQHDLVIIPPEGKTKFQDQIFGSTTMHLMRKCPCPVWVVKSNRQRKYFRILAAVNLRAYEDKVDPLNTQIMELATSLAQWDECKLDIIFAWYLQNGRYLREFSQEERNSLFKETQSEYKYKMDKFSERFKKEGHKFKTHVKKGQAIRVIPEMVKKKQIDLIIMGTLSRKGIEGLLIGNTAEGVLQQVDCSVLTVKPEGFISPIK